MLMYYVMTTMWRALNQRGLRRVYAQSKYKAFYTDFWAAYNETCHDFFFLCVFRP